MADIMIYSRLETQCTRRKRDYMLLLVKHEWIVNYIRRDFEPAREAPS